MNHDVVSLAGISLRQPALRYECTDLPFGSISLEHLHLAASFSTSKLTLHLTEAAAQKSWQEATNSVPSVASAPREIHFSMRDWAERVSPVSSLPGTLPSPTPEGWLPLVATHHLLDHPAYLWEDLARNRSEWDEPSRQALHYLQSLWRMLLTPCPTGEYSFWTTLDCNHCTPLRKAEQDASRSNPSLLARVFKAAVSPFNTAPTPKLPPYVCPHVALACEGLTAVFQQHPELFFWLIGWFACEVPPTALRDASNPNARSRRFVLSPYVIKVILHAQWLGDLTPGLSDYGAYSHRFAGGSRRVARGATRKFRWRAPRRDSPSTAVKVSAGQKAALAFSQQAWGITVNPEEVVVMAQTPEPQLPPVEAERGMNPEAGFLLPEMTDAKATLAQRQSVLPGKPKAKRAVKKVKKG